MKIIAISASNRNNSYNTALLHAIKQFAEADTVEIIPDISTIPLFTPDTDANSKPDVIQHLARQITHADAVVIASPEYAHGIPGCLKNVLDWLVDEADLVLKPIMLCSVSTSALGGARAVCALNQVLTAMNWNIVIESTLNIPFARSRFDADNHLCDELTRQRIKLSLKTLERFIQSR